MQNNFEKAAEPEAIGEAEPDLEYRLDTLFENLADLEKSGKLEPEDFKMFETTRKMIGSIEDEEMQKREKEILIGKIQNRIRSLE